MIPSRVIERKRDGHAVDPEEMAEFFRAYMAGDVTDYHMSAFLMAVYFQGLDSAETAELVRAMVASGETLDLTDLPGPRVDKHSTGGVGDKVSLVLAPLAAEMGIRVPMMSGRGLGHTAGTLDKLEAIPGFRTDVGLAEFREILERVGCAMIGQTEQIAPLDRRLYALRDVTATVPAIPLISASIMSKKLAEGLTGLVLDVKVGSGAFIPQESRALELARTMVSLGAAGGLPTVALLTAMDRPLGRAVGNGLETAEAVECLAGDGPPDLREVVVALAVEMVCLAEPDTTSAQARDRVEACLRSGRPLARFARLVEAQGGDVTILDHPGRLASAPLRRDVRAVEAGTVSAVHPRPLGEGVVELGGGRLRVGQEIHPGVGFVLHVQGGSTVTPGTVLATVHALDEEGLGRGEEVVRRSIVIDEDEVDLRPLVSHRVTDEGVEVVEALHRSERTRSES